ncbi:GL13871 [Drosophila persimilis]|uniref:ubiquitinyl hydrolase 1 n=1 Tax=Drosophila persimilis TaxID=7234 RepID=B4GPG1_DROPE|nr:GL13871 [Drosophila persimilis]
MCEVCTDFQNLLELYEARVASSELKFQLLLKSEIETTFNYIQSWPQRQCMCLYRDNKNYDRFNLVVQSLICLTVQHLKHIDHLIENYKRLTASAAQVVAQAQQQQQQQRDSSNETESPSTENENKPKESSPTGENRKESGADEIQAAGDGPPKRSGPSTPPPPPPSVKAHIQYTEEPWILPEVEKLLVLVSKVFLLNFPLYIAHKHGMHSRLDDLQAEEAHHLALICDLHDNELPIYLLRNVSLFCNSGGFGAMSLCFEHPDLPVSTAHSMTAAVSNVKLWLNYHCNTQLFVPLRSRILQFMCKLSDQNLRSAATRAMADFVWSSLRDPLDVAVNFDTEGLALAFKYFTSTTLTMRLAGMSQINSHINLFNEICTTETVNEVELFGQRIANWLTENHIVQHLFGPNLHVEIVKQAHVLLNFLAVENQISEDDIKLIWQATQLKHCSKTIFDILPSLVKNLAPRPAMHLYSLLCRMDPKDHTEQSIYIASALTKLLWTRDCSRSQMNLMQDHLLGANVTASSSDSGSIEGSNTEDDHVGADDSSVASGGGGGGGGVAGPICQKSPIDGIPPCKQARHRRHICDPTTEKGKQLGPEGKVEMVNNRIVNIIDNTSSEEELQSRAALELQLHRNRKKTSNKRRRQKAVNKQMMVSHDLVEIWDGPEDVPSSDDGDADGDGELLADSDDCSDGTASQLVPSAVLKHLHGEGPYIRAIAETNISELLSGGENDGSYSSPMSNKSEKNLADFDDEDVSPCEEELAQLVNSHAGRVAVAGANCRDVPPAFAAAAAAMMVAQSAMAMQKSGETNVAAAVAAVAAAAVATDNAQQSLVATMRQANANAAAAVAAAAANKSKSDSDGDLLEVKQPQQHNSSKGGTNTTSVQPSFKLNDVCLPGNTLLWDLLQDEKIGQLGESLALEAEKALATLLCFSMDRQLRTKFIEGCLFNVANNRSVIVSLRLLPKLFASFQQFRPSDTHSMTLWAERNHRMMQCFFQNIRFYARRHAELLVNQNGEQQQQQLGGQLYSHKTQVSVRLQFLSSIFSTVGSPKTFRLTLEQLDALWEWLAHDPECADCYFSWLQAQAKGGDQHALGIEALQHLYLKKLPELRPEEFSMVALGLFQQLCSFARIAMAEYDKHNDQISSTASAVGMYHLWKIALRAQSNEVSLAAIQYINMYYMGQQLRLEKEFVSQCMENLVQAATALESIEDENALMRVQRGLLLLNTHLDTFRRRYAFHLRRWAIEGKGIASHSNLKNEGAGAPLRILLQQAGLSEKSSLQMHACDLIADLKAEVSKWWESLQTGMAAPVLGLLLSDGPLRIITQGQELTSDYDERSLGDAGFKDNQIVYVSLGGRGARRKESNLEHPSMLPPPPKECLPTVLLLQPKYFEKLFCLMQTLGDMKPQASAVNLQHHTKAQLLSRRVWDILAMLPTNPQILDAFKSLVTDLGELEQLDATASEDKEKEEQLANKRKQIKQKFRDLLDPNNLQKFMYSLHIVESLALSSVRREANGNFEVMRGKKSSSSMARRRNSNEPPLPPPEPNSKQQQQAQICELLEESVLSGGQQSDTEASGSSGGDKENQPSSSSTTTTTKQQQQQHCKRQKKSESLDRPVGCATPPSPIPPPPPLTTMAQAIPTGPAPLVLGDNKWSEAFVKCGGLRHLYEIFIAGQLQQSSYPKEVALNEWRHDCLASLLRILWLLGFEELHSPDIHVLLSRPHPFMLQLMEVPQCLRRLSSILNDEVYQNVSPNSLVFPYQFHQLRTGFWGRAQLVQFSMNILVSFIHASAEARRVLWSQGDPGMWLQKFILEDPEPSVRREICAGLYRICLGNAQSYRLLLAPLLHKLITLLPMAEQMSASTQHTQFLLSEEGKEPYGPACRDYFWLLARLVDTLSSEIGAEEHIDIEMLCESISQSILTRDYYELRQGFQDDAMVGLLNLMSNLIKHDTRFKYKPKILVFMDQLLGLLFDMPSPSDRHKPKCKSPTSRAAAFDLLMELTRGCATNFTYLHGRLMAQHKSGPKPPYPWDYWPRDEGRADCGYVGLTNLGATCYMASCIQHLYMMPQARAAVLRVPPAGAQKYELVGVTVHTGTADGGHYYSFIKERTKNNFHPLERWFLFNDAEVKPFDPSQIAAECFGGEMTSKTYDSVTEKYLDFSFEKTNSAYMLFYERRLPEHLQRRHSELLVTPTPSPAVEEKPEAGAASAQEEEEVEVEETPKVEKVEKESESKKEEPKEKLEERREGKMQTDRTDQEEEQQQPQEEQQQPQEEQQQPQEEQQDGDGEGEHLTANCDNSKPSNSSSSISEQQPSTSKTSSSFKLQLLRPLLNKELEDWIWQDNRQFLQERNIFDHTYFNQSLVQCLLWSLPLEKPTMVHWVELLTKEFIGSHEACEWFLSQMALEPFWPVQVLIQCPNQMVRQMFQRLVIHVIQQLRASHADLFLDVETDDEGKELIGQASCVTRFIGSLISLLEHGARSHLRHLSEYFSLLCEFSRMGDEEAMFLLRIGVLKSLVDFYLGNKQTTDSIEISSDNEDNSSDEALSVEKMRPASLDKMIALCASLVERSRGPDFRLKLSPKDFNAIAGGKGFPFLYQQIKDGINPHQTKHLIHALCRWDDRLATQIVSMLFASVTKHTELCAPFFKLLTLLTETQGGPVGLPCFTQLILPRMWDAAEYCPQSVLDWLSLQATKNKIAHAWILQSAEQWLEQFLLAHDNTRVRNAAAFLLVALVPSQPFRANFRAHSQHKLLALNPHSYRDINSEAQVVLHQVITLLLRLLRPARVYADIASHGTTKLTAYFNLLSYCMVSKTEKLMASSFMRSLWELFHPRLSEPSVPAHHNKHALLTFWHHSLVDCPENAAQVASCPEITRNIAFNYILADHDDAEIVTYNRSMLPAYYGLLRLCCEQSRALTRQLAQHQNLQWAFKNITPHPTQYAAAVDELFKLMALFATRHPDAGEQEKLDVIQFRRTIIMSYMSSLDARVSWSTLISALKILVDNEDDRMVVIFNGGIEMCFEALHTLHSMHHEATACHVAGDLFDLLGEMLLLLATLRTRTDSPAQKKQQQQQQQLEQQLQLQQQQLLQKQQQQTQSTQAPQTPQQKEKQLQQQMQQHLQLQQLQHMQFQQQHFLRQQHQHTALAKALPDAVKRLATLLNTFNSPEISRMALEVLKELVRNTSLEATNILAPILINCHLSVANAPNAIGPLGPFFPRRGAKHTPWPLGAKNSPRPPRPMVQMCIALSELTPRGLDAEYDAHVEAFYRPYHDFIDVMMRMCVNTGSLNDTLVKLHCLVAIESTPLHFNYFPKFWVGIHNNALTHKYTELLVKNQLLVEYLHNVLRDERSMLKDTCVREFLELYYHRVATQLPVARMIYTINYGMHSKDDIDELCGDLFAIRIIAEATGVPATVRKELRGSLRALQNKSERFRIEAERDEFPNKKQKRDSYKEKEKDQAAQSDTDNSSVTDPSKATDVSMEVVATNSLNSDPVVDKTAKPPTPAGSEDEQMESTSSEKLVEKAGSTPSSDDETELEDELEPTPKRNKKSSNKKTAQDRLNEEREKHLITLITMESYIQKIFSILKRDSKQIEEQAAASEASTSTAAAAAAAAAKARPKGAHTPPEPPMPEASMETETSFCGRTEAEKRPHSPVAGKPNGSQPMADDSLPSVIEAALATPTTPAVASTSQAASPTQM